MKQSVIKLFVLCTMLLSLNAFAAEQDNNTANMLKRVMPAVVNIQAEGMIPSGSQAQRMPMQKNNSPNGDKPGNFASIGSGVIVNAKQGLILSNAHVLLNAKNITVTLNDGRRFKAKIKGLNTNFDIAVIQIKANNLTQIPLGDSSKLDVGDKVIAIGSPFNLRQSVTSGIVSALHRSVRIEGFENFIQIDAAINVGSSGGALVNSHGQLVGINTAIISPEGGNIGIGFAIPSNLATKVAQQLLKYGKLERGILGVLVQDLTPDLATSFDSKLDEGALVSQVSPNTPAAKAGFKPGDIITKVNDTIVTNAADIRNNVALLRPGATAKITVIRQKKSLQLTAQVISEEALKAAMAKQHHSLLNGVSMENFDQLTLNYGHVKGVQIDFVKPSSDAWSAQLRPGDVIIAANHQPVSNLVSLEKLLNLHQSRILLHILRGNGAFYLVIP